MFSLYVYSSHALSSRIHSLFLQAALQLDNYSVSVAASVPSTRRLRRALAATDSTGEDGSCSSRAEEVKDMVMTALSSHERFVSFLEKSDMSKKCAKKHMATAVGHHSSNLFEEGGCELTFGFALKLDSPFLVMMEDVIRDALAEEGVVLKDVVTTKINCKSRGGRSGSGKRGKGNKSSSKAGKPGKK